MRSDCRAGHVTAPIAAHRQPPRRGVCMALLGLALSSASLARADDCGAGAWRGTLGADRVTVLLDTIGAGGELAGRYYRNGEFIDHLLARSAADEPWSEMQDDASTSVQFTLSCNGDTLTGERRADATREPLRATSIVNAAFDDTRMADAALVRTDDSFALTHPYARVASSDVDAVSGLHLAGDEPGIARINARLTADFRTSITTALACAATGRLRGSDDDIFYFTHEETPLAWSAEFVVVRVDESGYCGGAHPYFGTTGNTYALHDGTRENVGDWLDLRYREEVAKDSELGQLVMARFLGDSEDAGEDCRDVVTLPNSGGALWPQADGLVFQAQAPYVASGCVEDIVVPWADVLPFLSARGRAAAAGFAP